MSRMLEPVVPDVLRRKLATDPLAEDGFTILVLSDAAGWPHLAMISAGEIVCAEERELRLALWPSSTACANLVAHGRATLCAVLDGVGYSVRVATRRLGDIRTPLAGTLACFQAHVEAVAADEAPYAVLESGVRFRLVDPSATLERWREVRAVLQRGGAPP
jgi:hypothetical protein